MLCSGGDDTPALVRVPGVECPASWRAALQVHGLVSAAAILLMMQASENLQRASNPKYVVYYTSAEQEPTLPYFERVGSEANMVCTLCGLLFAADREQKYGQDGGKTGGCPGPQHHRLCDTCRD